MLVTHAAEMVEVLRDPELYRFIPQEPPDLAQLQKTYAIWSRRVSPQGDELWLNWIARSKGTGEGIGHFQAGVKEGADSSIAYTVGIRHQRKGYAEEALRAVLGFLCAEFRLDSAKAWIDTRNLASITLVRKLGMVQVDFIQGADRFKSEVSDEWVFELRLGSIPVNS